MTLKLKSSCLLFFPFLPFSLGPSKNTEAKGPASALRMQQELLFTSIESSPGLNVLSVYTKPDFHSQVTVSLLGSESFRNVPAHNSSGTS